MSEPKKASWLTAQNLKDIGLAVLMAVTVAVAGIDKGCRELPTPAPAPQPSPVGPVDPVPIERWYVTRNGEVLDSPEVIAVAEALEAGQYELVGYPKAGKIRRVGVGISDNAPAPLPPAPVPPGPTPPNPTPVPPQPPLTGLAAEVAQRAAGIDSRELLTVAGHYEAVASKIAAGGITTLANADAEIFARIRELSLPRDKWVAFFEWLSQTLDRRSLRKAGEQMDEIAVGLRAAGGGK
jgi:hypothetical protein